MSDMKTETVLVVKPGFIHESPRSLTVNPEPGNLYSDPCSVAGDHVWTKNHFKVGPCMIEDTSIEQESEKAWWVRVDYYVNEVK